MPKKYSVDAPPGMKSCPDCGETKPIERFHREPKHRDGRKTYCRECVALRRSTWYVANRVQQTAKVRARYAADLEIERARSRQNASRWRHANIEVARERDRARLSNQQAYRVEHRERYRQLHDGYRNDGRYDEVKRSWQRAHPEKLREYASARRALRRNVFVECVDFKAIIARDRWTCGLCGGKVKPSDLNMDHIIPLSKNGPHAHWNLQVSHEVCNKSKGNKLIGQPRLPI